MEQEMFDILHFLVFYINVMIKKHLIVNHIFGLSYVKWDCFYVFCLLLL